MNDTYSLRVRVLTALAAGCLLGGLAACNVAQPAQDDPTRYYVLSDTEGQAPAPQAVGARIGLKTVKLAGYLRRKEMVVRTGGNEVEFRDFRRWAEPLDAAITRIVKARLLGSAQVAQVLTEPFPPDQEPDYVVSIEVRACEGTTGRSGSFGASFTAAVEVSTAGANPRVVSRKLFTAPGASWDGRDFDKLASLLTADASALGQEIASEIPARN